MKIIKTEGTKTSVGSFMIYDDKGNDVEDENGNNAWDTYEEAEKVLKSEKRSTIVYDTQNELADMTVNDFTNLIDKYDLGIAELDAMFYDLLEILVKERTKDE
jgi:hypothetical protein